MKRYDVRFYDKKQNRLIYGAGISPNQLPLVISPDGAIVELQGDFVPMICTYQKAINGHIWEADVVECDVPVMQFEGMPPTFMKVRGVMQYNQGQGCFTISINSTPEMQGAVFKVVNTRIIGCALTNPELLSDPNKKANEIKQTS